MITTTGVFAGRVRRGAVKLLESDARPRPNTLQIPSPEQRRIAFFTMRSSTITAATALAILFSASTTLANPYPPLVANAGADAPSEAALELRDYSCSNPCGWHGQYCCGASETCVTRSGDIATCIAGAANEGATAGGGYQFFTTTYVMQGPVTITSTGSYLASAVQTPVPGGSPIACSGSTNSCGSMCCTDQEYCSEPGKCAPIGSQSAPLRPTSNAVATATATITGAMTTISGLGTAVPTGEAAGGGGGAAENNGLSAGAIAGIVIGVLVGLFILFLILACLCCKGMIDGLMALLGCGRKRRVEETTVIQSHHSHHGSGGRPPQRTWFGFQRPGRTEVIEEKKKSSGIGGLLGAGGILAALAIILGLKRRRDRQRSEKEHQSDYGSASYYSYEDDYSTSESKSAPIHQGSPSVANIRTRLRQLRPTNAQSSRQRKGLAAIARFRPSCGSLKW